MEVGGWGGRERRGPTGGVCSGIAEVLLTNTSPMLSPMLSPFRNLLCFLKGEINDFRRSGIILSRIDVLNYFRFYFSNFVTIVVCVVEFVIRVVVALDVKETITTIKNSSIGIKNRKRWELVIEHHKGTGHVNVIV